MMTYLPFQIAWQKVDMKYMLHNGLTQSNHVILRQCNLSDGYMLQQIQGKLKNGITVSNVWIYDGLGVRLLYTEG